MLNPESNRKVPETVLNWAPDAPKGGKAVMNRVLKDGASVPLFFAQTLVASLRDVGPFSSEKTVSPVSLNSDPSGKEPSRVALIIIHEFLPADWRSKNRAVNSLRRRHVGAQAGPCRF